MEFTSRQLRAFLLVAQHESFTRAAEALFITPSGLSVLIRELENQLGFRLFDRTTRRVALSDHGSALFPVAQRNLDEMERASARIGKSARQAASSISVGATPLMITNVLSHAVCEFNARRPDFRVRLYDGVDPPAIFQMVEERKIDMALGAFFKRSMGIRRTPLFRSSLMLIRPEHGRHSGGDSTPWSALQGETLYTVPAGRPLQHLVSRHLARAGAVPKEIIVLNYLETQIAMVDAGEGVAVVPSFALPMCQNRNIEFSRLTDPEVHVDFHAVRNRARKLPAGADDFIAFLQNYMSKWARRMAVL
jgi:LysR family transcriptional regulator, carnitine catabolism transcriptional activator